MHSSCTRLAYVLLYGLRSLPVPKGTNGIYGMVCLWSLMSTLKKKLVFQHRPTTLQKNKTEPQNRTKTSEKSRKREMWGIKIFCRKIFTKVKIAVFARGYVPTHLKIYIKIQHKLRLSIWFYETETIEKISSTTMFITGIFIHLVFLFSIFDIYFKSPIVKNVGTYQPLHEAPAHRLVLFVVDGLRAESFVNYTTMPYLR